MWRTTAPEPPKGPYCKLSPFRLELCYLLLDWGCRQPLRFLSKTVADLLYSYCMDGLYHGTRTSQTYPHQLTSPQSFCFSVQLMLITRPFALGIACSNIQSRFKHLQTAPISRRFVDVPATECNTPSLRVLIFDHYLQPTRQLSTSGLRMLFVWFLMRARCQHTRRVRVGYVQCTCTRTHHSIFSGRPRTKTLTPCQYLAAVPYRSHCL